MTNSDTQAPETNLSNGENQGSRFRALAELDRKVNIDGEDMEKGFPTLNKENIAESREHNKENYCQGTQEVDVVPETCEHNNTLA